MVGIYSFTLRQGMATCLAKIKVGHVTSVPPCGFRSLSGLEAPLQKGDRHRPDILWNTRFRVFRPEPVPFLRRRPDSEISLQSPDLEIYISAGRRPGNLRESAPAFPCA